MSTKKSSSVKAKKGTGTPKKKPADYLKEPYARILIPEADGTFSAELLEFPGCFSQGRSPDEAFKNLQEAAKSWIEVALDQGQEIPPPSANYGYGGRIALRLPRSLHRLAARRAERDGISLNQCLVTAIAAWLGADDLYARLAERLYKPPLQLFASANIWITYNANKELIGLKVAEAGNIGMASIPTSFTNPPFRLPAEVQEHTLTEAHNG